MSTITQPDVKLSRATWTVAVFCVLFAISMLDRLILLVLARPMADSLHITDEQTGLLFGTGFALVYTLGGLLIARLLDKGNRKLLAVAGVTIWSASTVASAFASSFPALMVLRCGVAIGEAVLTPAAVSIFADLFRPERRGLPTAVFVSSATIMSPGAFFIGASILGAASSFVHFTDMEPWRLTLIFVGMPGLIMAAVLLLTVREPRRVADVRVEPEAGAEASTGFFAGRPQLWISIAAMHALGAVAFMGWIAWTASLLVRKFGLSVEEAGQMFGMVGLIGSISAMLTWPTLDLKLGRWLGRSPTALLYCVAAICTTIVVVVTGVAQSVTVVLVCTVLCLFFNNGVMVLPNIIVQNVSPSANRARLAALMILANGLIGTGFGPLLTATVADRFFEKVNGLGFAMATIAAITLPLILVLGFRMQALYRTALEEIRCR